MTLKNELYPASFKGAPFLISIGKTSGGRKDVLHSFPNSNKQTVEDLGLNPRTFEIQGIINEPNYIQKRDNLLQALEEGGTGALIHPLFGNLSNMVCRSFILNEDLTELGDGKISMIFTVSDDLGIPVGTEDTVSFLGESNSIVLDATNSDIANGFSISRKFRESFVDATATLNRAFDAFDEKTKIVAQATDATNEFSSLINTFSTNINNLARQPQALADSINNIFQNINGLYATISAVSLTGNQSITTGVTPVTEVVTVDLASAAKNTLAVFENFFDFDDDQVELLPTTVSKIERQTNNDIIKQTMQLNALSFSYLNAAQVEFGTVDDIDETADRLEAQFKKIIENNDELNKLLLLSPEPKEVGNETINALKDMRTQTQQFFEAAKLTVKQIITVKTVEIPVRVLTYQYYGSSELSEDIVALNDDPNVSFYKGDIKILTS